MAKFAWLIGGEAGFGIREAGVVFAKTCARAGFNIFGYAEYPSLIRGGHNTYQVSVDEEVFSQSKQINLLVALNKETIERHKAELTKNAAIIYDSAESLKSPKGLKLYPVPLLKLAEKSGGKEIVRNAVALGASCALIGLDFSIIDSVLRDEFKPKGQDIADMNAKAAHTGYEYLKSNFKDGYGFGFKLKAGASPGKSKKIVLTGNDAIGIGAIKAGCKFFAGYPMTPVTPLIHFMAQQARNFGIVFRNASDEIEAINMAIGASYAGARSMVATSGGGFSLMVEAYGMAGMTETPVVVIEGTRTGPSTGLPTWTEQGDLRFVLHASQGEFPRIVVAPGDVSECYYKTIEAFNLAEKYQVPALVLTDRYLAESHMSAERFDTNFKIRRWVLSEEELERMKGYKRFLITKTGVSPRSLPGQKNGLSITNSYEHDEYGFYSENAEIVRKMKGKRMRKMESVLKEIPEPVLYGDRDSDITIIAWGSTKLPVLQAMKTISEQNEQKIRVNLLHVVYISPFKTEKIGKVLGSAKKVLIVENNQTAQLAGLIREKTGIEIKNKLLKYDGRQFYADEIVGKVKEVLRKR